MMAKGGELDVRCKETVGLRAGQCDHLRELFVNREIFHILHPNSTGVTVMSHHRCLNHGEEDKLVVIFTFDDAAGEPQPH